MRLRLLFALLALLLLCPLACSSDFSPGFPRVAMQTQRGDEPNAFLDRAAAGDAFMVSGWLPASDLQYVKSKNPDIRLVAFIGSFCGIRKHVDDDPEHGTDYSRCAEPQFHERSFFACELYEWLEENDGWLYRADGQRYVGFVAVDGTKLYMFCMAEGCPAKDSQGRRLADFYSDLVNSMIFENAFGYQKVDLWDGTMFDCAGDMGWTIDLYNDGVGPDFDRDGVGDRFDPNMRNEEVRFFQRVRQYAGTEHAFFVNGVNWGQQYLNGFQIENMLRRGNWNCGGNQECQWQMNMFYTFPSGWGHGYLAVQDLYLDQPFRAGMPHIGWCCGTEEAPAPCSQSEADIVEFNRFKRYAIGTVALGDGFLSFNWNAGGCNRQHTQAWPLPENYNGLPGTPDYLGQALGPCKVVEDDGTLTACRELAPGSIKVYRRDFDNGIVLVNPSYFQKVVALEKPYRVLDVVERFTVPGGTVVESVTLRPFDSIILLGIESTATPTPTPTVTPTATPTTTPTPTPTISPTPTPEPCSPDGEVRDCQVDSCAGIQVCTEGFWGECVKEELCCDVNCDDGNSCTADSCNPADGTCSNVDTCGGGGTFTGGGSGGGGGGGGGGGYYPQQTPSPSITLTPTPTAAQNIIVPEFVSVEEAGDFGEDFDIVASEGVHTGEVQVLLQQSQAEAKKGNIDKARVLFDAAKKRLALLKAQVVARKAEFNWKWALATAVLVLAAGFYFSSTLGKKPPETGSPPTSIALPGLPDELLNPADKTEFNEMLEDLRK